MGACGPSNSRLLLPLRWVTAIKLNSYRKVAEWAVDGWRLSVVGSPLKWSPDSGDRDESLGRSNLWTEESEWRISLWSSGSSSSEISGKIVTEREILPLSIARDHINRRWRRTFLALGQAEHAQEFCFFSKKSRRIIAGRWKRENLMSSSPLLLCSQASNESSSNSMDPPLVRRLIATTRQRIAPWIDRDRIMATIPATCPNWTICCLTWSLLNMDSRWRGGTMVSSKWKAPSYRKKDN